MRSATGPAPSRCSSLPALPAEPTLGVYVHWPFCQSKCPYCDFNSHVREAVDQARWRDALIREIETEAALTPGRQVVSIFFGGGTPSLMPPQTVAAVLAAIRRGWPVAPDVEITLEANPSSVEASRFAALAAAGVNRVSLGLQALDDAALAFLGRRHNAAEGLAALAIARSVFERVSFDLIYARPGQSADDWQAELSRALDMGTGHLSLYQLTIEPGTAFAEQYRRKRFTLPDEDSAADLFALTRRLTAEAGLPAYETSNHARPGEVCAHNLIYWRYLPYVGIGPGAHGRRPGTPSPMATERLARPEAWLAAVEAHGHGLSAAAAISAREQADEAVMMGLRLAEGIDLAAIARHSGVAEASVVSASALPDLLALGLITQQGSRITASAAGHLVLNSVIARLLV